MRRLPPLLLAAGLAATGLAGCRDGTVQLSFRPPADATYRYEVVVETRSERRLTGAEPVVRAERLELTAVHRVLESDDEGVRVEVELQPRGHPSQAFVVVFGRGAELEGFESASGPADATGGLGLPELFPAGAAAPPGRPLEPGERWLIDERVTVPGAEGRSRLVGEGRLAELGVVDGAEVARIVTSARLPLRARVREAGGLLLIRGHQHTDHRATHDLVDGAVRSARSATVGRYDLELAPPAGASTGPVTGTLVVHTESRTRRIA